MKCNPWRWLWGLPLLVMLTWITLLLEQDRIQADLRERSIYALQQQGIDAAKATFVGRDGILTGRASGEEQPAVAARTVLDVWGVRIVDADMDVIGRVADYIWSATLVDNKVLLSGYVPDEEARTRLSELVRKSFPQTQVEDVTILGSGAPSLDRWFSGIEFGLTQLSSLSSGSVDLNGLGLSVAGEAPTTAVFKTVKRALRGEVPKGIELVSDKVLPPIADPFKWAAERSSRQLVMSGYVPSDQMREGLFSYAKSLFADIAIIDRMETARGAPDGFEQAARAALSQLAFVESGEATLAGTSLALTGKVGDAVTADAVREKLGVSVPIGISASTDLEFPEPAPPVVTPFVTRATFSQGEVLLTGYVPDEEARDRIVRLVKDRFSDATILDNMELASGQGPGWEPCLVVGLSGLSRLDDGRIVVSERSLQVEGRSQNEAVAEALPADVRAMANRSCDSDVRVSLDLPPEPDLTWRATHRGEGEVLLDGDVPDAETRAMLVSEATRLFPNARIVDRMSIVLGNSTKWRAVAMSGLGMLSKLRSGEAVVSGQELLLRGEAKDTAVAAALKDRLKHGLEKGYGGRDLVEIRSDAMIWAEMEAKRKAREEAELSQRKAQQAEMEEEARIKAENAARIKALNDARLRAEELEQREQREAELFAREREERLRELEARSAAEAEQERRLAAQRRISDAQVAVRRAEADQCQTLLRSAATEGTILFRFASSALDSRSFPTLGKLVKIANECPGFRIEIEGHTDAEGSPEINKKLSEERAQSVVDHLVNEGVRSERLKAVGYGETRPVASNDTPANRAKNRRIEFSVKID